MDFGISEIFSSVQGEGKYVGCRQLFIRLIGCNMDCPYCDTNTLAHVKSVPCLLEAVNGYQGKLKLANPVKIEDVLPYIKYRLHFPHHSVSITGGEPLLFTDFIRMLANEIKSFNVPLFLETNGTLPEQLKKVIDIVDIISMDIKLPSDVQKEYWQVHENFLRIAAQKDVYVKIVVSHQSKEEDFIKAIDIIKNINENILLVLQPITPLGGLQEAPPQKMLEWQDLAMRTLRNVRVIPQTHRLLNLR